MRDRLLAWTYQLNRHRWGEIPLSVVAVVGLFLLAGAVYLGWLGGGWPLAGLLLVLGVALALLSAWGRFTGYVRFSPAPMPLPAEPPQPLVPTDKVRHRASGWFEVEGKARYLVEVQAWFRTFESREHAVMAYLPASRLFPGRWPDHEVGMWYIFFRPETIRRVEPGYVHFGARPRPGLRVVYDAGEREERVLLSFESEEDRQRVYADLMKNAAMHHHGARKGG